MENITASMLGTRGFSQTHKIGNIANFVLPFFAVSCFIYNTLY